MLSPAAAAQRRCTAPNKHVPWPTSRRERRLPRLYQPSGITCCSNKSLKDGVTRSTVYSDLHNMTETVKAHSETSAKPDGNYPSRLSAVDVDETLKTSGRGTEPTHQQRQRQQAVPNNSAVYYAGLLATDVRFDNKASSADMLKRNLQLAGYMAALLGGLIYLFMLSNDLL